MGDLPSGHRSTYLPFQLSSFVGREREMAQLEPLVLRNRLVTLTGAGGAGKSRLAFEVASRLAPEFPDGVCPVELAPLEDPALVPRAVAHALGIIDQADDRLVYSVIVRLDAGERLLVLDNCEHVLFSCAALVETLLCRCSSDLRILATSREPLAVPGEVVWLVPPLAAPDAGALPDSGAGPQFDTIAAFEAVRLFAARAASVAPGFTLTAANAPVVGELCGRLEGLPLAIELAAGRVRVLTPRQLAERLAEGLDVLSDGARPALPHHHTMTAAIGWSYCQLSAEESAALRRLSVFRGGWSLDAAEDVGEGVTARSAILAVLARLVERSLVVAEARDDEMRYRLLEPIRQYAAERLREAAEEDAARERHFAHFLALVETARPELRRADQLQWLDRLDRERDNLRAALSYGLQRASASRDFAQQCLRFVHALEPYWSTRGDQREGLRWTDEALTSEHSATRDVLRIRALTSASLLAQSQNKPETRQEPHVIEALEILNGTDESCDHERAEALRVLGRARMGFFEWKGVRELFEESRSLFRKTGDRLGEADSIAAIGNFLREDDRNEARALFQQSIAMYEEAGDRLAQLNPRLQLGHICFFGGEPERAETLHLQCLHLAEASGNKFEVWHALHNLGECTQAALGDNRKAEPYLRRALELALENGFSSGGVEQVCLAECEAERGNIREAMAFLREAFAWGRAAYDDAVAFIWGDARLAHVRIAQRRFREAAVLLGASFRLEDALPGGLDEIIHSLRDRYVGLARARMSPGAFEAAFAEGRHMTVDEAVRIGVATLEEEPTEPAPQTPAQAAKQQYDGVTAREREVAAYVGRGLTNAEIAATLSVSERTVEVHVSNILSKLDCTSRTQVAAWAIRKGLTNT